ncbi:MAG: hypothetical protein J5689_03645 [Clostridia bacterium]|nr:hypothetical protein [Clostridia bacterium]
MKRELRLNQLKTPENVVNIMLDLAGYYGEKILDKKVCNLCFGEGTILIEIIKRYIFEYNKKYGNLDGISSQITELISGVEIDKLMVTRAYSKINLLLKENSISAKINLKCCDALNYNNCCDYCFCFPPFEFIIEPSNFKEKIKSSRFKFDKKSYYIKFLLKAKQISKKVVFICPSDILSNQSGVEFLMSNVNNISRVHDLSSYDFYLKPTIALCLDFSKEDSVFSLCNDSYCLMANFVDFNQLKTVLIR